MTYGHSILASRRRRSKRSPVYCPAAERSFVHRSEVGYCILARNGYILVEVEGTADICVIVRHVCCHHLDVCERRIRSGLFEEHDSLNKLQHTLVEDQLVAHTADNLTEAESLAWAGCSSLEPDRPGPCCAVEISRTIIFDRVARNHAMLRL
jgi:hypothetical protein